MFNFMHKILIFLLFLLSISVISCNNPSNIGNAAAACSDSTQCPFLTVCRQSVCVAPQNFIYNFYKSGSGIVYLEVPQFSWYEAPSKFRVMVGDLNAKTKYSLET